LELSREPCGVEQRRGVAVDFQLRFDLRQPSSITRKRHWDVFVLTERCANSIESISS
jgi:hypothetical protein